MSKDRLTRSRARFAAAQALYQMDLSGEDTDQVVDEFLSHRLGFDRDGEQGEALAEADETLFRAIVNGVVGKQVEIDKSLASALSEGWPLERIDATLRALLRAATFELLGTADTPARVILDEYVKVADAFFGGAEVGFANGVLNTLARRTRPAEFGLPAT
ncbi:MAG: transcription antitermination factor NusB [Alphaproteobacteria bacterium]|nr:transcription antitermination factor NusB [Alphaproteobacteria bacterium]